MVHEVAIFLYALFSYKGLRLLSSKLPVPVVGRHTTDRMLMANSQHKSRLAFGPYALFVLGFYHVLVPHSKVCKHYMVFAPVCTGTTTGESDHVSSCTIKVEICAEASFPCTISICVASSSLLKVRKERKFSKHATNSCNSTYSQWIQEIVIVIDL